MTNEEIIASEFLLLSKDLASKYDELGMRASGRFERGLEVEVLSEGSRIKAILSGESYTTQLVFGRKPGAMPPVQAIEQWIQDKGIRPIEDSLSISSLAFLIARKIGEEGTKYFQQGGTDLVESVITPERIQSIIGKVSVFEVNKFTNGIVEELKRLAA